MSHLDSNNFRPNTFSHDLQVRGFSASDPDRTFIQGQVDRVSRAVPEGDKAHLLVRLNYHSHSTEYEIHLTLKIARQTNVLVGTGPTWRPELQKLVRRMLRCVAQLHSATNSPTPPTPPTPTPPRPSKGTPTARVFGDAVAEAIQNGDYLPFREAMRVVEPSLQQQIGRSIKRYPDVQAMLGRRLAIADVMEVTLLMAFEKFEQWQPGSNYEPWIESLIDPALKAIARDPEGELQAIRFQQTWQEQNE